MIKIGMISLVALFAFSSSAMADKLHGHIFAVDEMGVEHPIDNIGISIGKTQQPGDVSKDNGKFELSIDKEPGDKVFISINRNGWSILSPYDGEFFRPKDLKNEELIVRIVPFPLNFYPSVYFDSRVMNGNSSGTHVVQVFVTTDRMKAANLVNSIKNQKLEARYETILGTPVQYRVLVGPFQNKTIADEARMKIIKDFNLGDKSFVKPRF